MKRLTLMFLLAVACSDDITDDEHDLCPNGETLVQEGAYWWCGDELADNTLTGPDEGQWLIVENGNLEWYEGEECVFNQVKGEMYHFETDCTCPLLWEIMRDNDYDTTGTFVIYALMRCPVIMEDL